MNYLLLSTRFLKFVKVDLIVVLVYSIVLTVYSINWNVINPFEFVLYTKYFVYPGFIIWCIFSSRYHSKLLGNIPLNWLELNNLSNKPNKINNKIFIYSLQLVLLYLVINGILISAVITINFASNFTLLLNLLKYYFAYYLFFFITAWILGYYFAYIIKHHGRTRQLVYIITTIVILVLMIYIDYSNDMKLFINRTSQFIHPILDLGNLLDRVLTKSILIAIFTITLIIFIKLKDSTVITIGVTLIIISLILTSRVEENDLEALLKSNDRILQQKIDNQFSNTKLLNESWLVDNIQLSPGDKNPIKVHILNKDKLAYIHFFLNEQFTLSKIIHDNKELDFLREGNIVQVETNGVPDITVLYDETIGTSIYPMLDNITFLPFQLNWYPQKVDTEHFKIGRDGNIESNVEMPLCDDLFISTKSSFTWYSDTSECLSVINGPFHNFILDEIQFIVYIPFVTRKDNYLNLINDIYRVSDEMCEFSKEENYCSHEVIKSISIVPKSMSSSTLSIFDTVNINGHYIFNVNLFTDVGYRSITHHLAELIAMQLPYRMLNDDIFSLFFGQYLIELLEIESFGYIDFMAEVNVNDAEKWNEYKSLNTADKKEVLHKMFDSGGGVNAQN